MSDYVSRQYLLNEYDRQHQGPPGGARKIIEEAPAEDVVPVVHIQWKYKCGEIQCPECGNRIRRIDLSGCLNFCPNCGAKMDGERKE